MYTTCVVPYKCLTLASCIMKFQKPCRNTPTWGKSDILWTAICVRQVHTGLLGPLIRFMYREARMGSASVERRRIDMFGESVTVSSSADPVSRPWTTWDVFLTDIPISSSHHVTRWSHQHRQFYLFTRSPAATPPRSHSNYRRAGAFDTTPDA